MEQHKLLGMIDELLLRDKQMLDELTSWMGDGLTIENRIELADARAKDALVTIFRLCKYIVESEKKV